MALLLCLGIVFPQAARADPSAVEDLPVAWIPEQRVGEPFATLTLGLTPALLLPARSAIELPTSGSAFERRAPPRLGMVGASIGALHFHEHAELYVTIPIVALGADATGAGPGRAVSAAYNMDTGVRYYPWALRRGTVRPFVSTGLMTRRIRVEDTPDPTANPGGDTTHLLPLGTGVSWRSRFGLLVTLEGEYRLGESFPVGTGVVPQPLSEGSPAYETRRLDLSGFRVLLAVSANFDASSFAVEPGFRSEHARRWAEMMRCGTASGMTVGVGPSSRETYNASDYFGRRRPYLAGPYSEPAFPMASLGYYTHRWDAELRVAGRYIWGSAEAHGASLQTGQLAGFLEVIKFIDPNYYGFVPFFGGGVGLGRYHLEDQDGQRRVTASESKVIPSVVLGWDIRITPATWWLLRTNIRWVPSADIAIANTRFDFGGFEYDFIQLVIFPGRL